MCGAVASPDQNGEGTKEKSSICKKTISNLSYRRILAVTAIAIAIVSVIAIVVSLTVPGTNG